jgi:cytochrome c oxidase assembly factor CtaG
MAPLATAYSGPPKLTLARAFTEWRVDLPMLLLILAVAVWYLVSARKVRQAGGQWGSGRTFAFIVLGLGFWVIATMAWPGVYESFLFYSRATQTVLLTLVSPLFLAMGKPLALFIEAYPGPGRRVERAVRSRVAKIATFPAITTLLLVAVPMTMYFTSWYTAYFDSGTVRELTYLILMVPGYVFFWTLLRVDPVPKEYPYGVGMWITAAEVVGDAFFGIAIIADQTIIAAGHYHAAGYPFGPTLATSQVLGGGIIWILGDFVGLPFLAVQLIQMMRADKREADQIDAELDARDAAREAARATARESAPAAEAVSAPAPGGSGTPVSGTPVSGTPVSGTPVSGTPVSGTPVSGASVSGTPGSGTPSAGPALLSSASPDAQGALPADPDPDDDEEDRPWWESDPRLTDRFRRA